MNQSPTPAGPPGQLPSEFRLPSGGNGLIVTLLSVLVVVFAAIVFLLVGRFLGLAMGLVVAVIVAVGSFVGMAVAVRSRKPRTTVRFFSFGVQLDDGQGFRLQLVWPDVTGIEPVDNRLAQPRASGGRGGADPRSPGLVGWGRREVPHPIPTWLRDHLASLPTDVGSGRVRVEIPLGAFDPRWWEGPMGAWLRRFRPDLTPPLPGSGGGPVLPESRPRIDPNR